MEATFVLSMHSLYGVFLFQKEGLRTEGVVFCTDCKACWESVVILVYMNKIDLTCLYSLISEMTERICSMSKEEVAVYSKSETNQSD